MTTAVEGANKEPSLQSAASIASITIAIDAAIKEPV